MAARFADCLPATGHASATSPYADAENAPGKPSAKLLAVPTSPVSPPWGFSLSHGWAELDVMPGWAPLASRSAPKTGQATLLLLLPLAQMLFCLLAEHEKYLRGLINMPGLRMLEPRGSQVAQLLGDNVGNPGGSPQKKRPRSRGWGCPSILPSPPRTRYFGQTSPVRLAARRAVPNQLSFHLPPTGPRHEAAAGPNRATENPPLQAAQQPRERYKWFEWRLLKSRRGFPDGSALQEEKGSEISLGKFPG